MSKIPKFTSAVFFVVLPIVLMLTCTSQTPNPYDQSKTTANLVLQSSNKQMSETSIQDSLGKTVRIGVASNIPGNLDSVNLKIFSAAGALEKETTLMRSVSSDTPWYETSLLPKGEHSVIANIFIHGGNTLSDSGKIIILAKEYALSITAVTGSVTLTPALAQYDSGSAVGLKAHPNAGYHFVNWTGDATGTSDSVIITMNGAKNITANFEVNAANMFVFAITSAYGNVTKTPDKAQYDSGSTVGLKANPNLGYHFVSWSGDASGTSDTATVIINGTMNVTATFAINTYQLRVNAGTGGTITVPSSLPITVNYGVTTAITASPSAGYDFFKWTITSGTAIVADANSASTTVTLTSGDATVQANFATSTYKLTVTAGTGGTITAPPSSPMTVNYGVATTITAAPTAGYIFANWTVSIGTATIAAANFPSTAVTLTSGDATVQANFKSLCQWTAVNSGLPNDTVGCLAVIGNNIFAGIGGSGVFLSANNGNSWTEVNNGLTNTIVYALAVSGNNLFAGTASGGVFLSSNNGSTWTMVLPNGGITSFAVSGNNIFAGTAGGVFLSSNNGTSWSAVSSGLTTT